MISQFAIDRAIAVIEEGLAIGKIEEWYRRQGFRVHINLNYAPDLEGQRGFDLIDTYGKKWEVKCDRLWHRTGNVFIEHQALEHSQADFYIILAGFAYILPRNRLLEAINGDYRVVQGGDELRATGTLLPLQQLELLSDIV